MISKISKIFLNYHSCKYWKLLHPLNGLYDCQLNITIVKKSTKNNILFILISASVWRLFGSFFTVICFINILKFSILKSNQGFDSSIYFVYTILYLYQASMYLSKHFLKTVKNRLQLCGVVPLTIYVKQRLKFSMMISNFVCK